MEIGIYTFGDRTPDPKTGKVISPQQRMHDLIEEAELADQVGLDVFGVVNIIVLIYLFLLL